MPSVVQVLPATSFPNSPTRQAVGGLYTVEGSYELPRVDAVRTIKSVWLSPSALRRVNAVLHRFARVLTTMNAIAGLVASAVAFYPAPVGRWIAPVLTPFMLPTLLAMFLGLRYEMVVLVVGTYDFWYQGITSIICPILFAMYTRDARGVAVIGMVPLLVVVLLADANYRAVRFTFALSVLAGILCMGDALVVVFGWVDDVHKLEIVHVYGRAVTAEAIMAHGFVVITIVHFHNAYVRRQFAMSLRERRPTARSSLTTTVRCVLYRSRLRWRDRAGSSRQSVERRPVKSSFDERSLQLKCHGLRQVFDARRTMCRWPMQGVRARWLGWLLHAGLLLSGLVGFVSVPGTFLTVALGREPTDSVVRVLGVVSVVGTVSVWLASLSCVHQLDMLRLLHSSFDFLFIFVQMVLVHLCICDLCGWDARALASLASLLWVHWALLIDAIPPLTRHRLGVPVRRVAMAVAASLLAAQVLFTLDIVSWQAQHFQDREIFTVKVHSGGRSNANWSVGSFFLNRFITLITWLGRFLFRLGTYDDDELVVLRGAVEYDDYEMHRRENRSISSKTQIQQITQALSHQSQRSQREVTERSQFPDAN